MRFHQTPLRLLAHQCPPSGPPSTGCDASCKNTSKEASPDPKPAPQPTANADLSRMDEYPAESRKMRHTSPLHRHRRTLVPRAFPPPARAGFPGLRLDLELLSWPNPTPPARHPPKAPPPHRHPKPKPISPNSSRFQQRIGFVLSFCPTPAPDSAEFTRLRYARSRGDVNYSLN
jgi:hypothetical protein